MILNCQLFKFFFFFIQMLKGDKQKNQGIFISFWEEEEKNEREFKFSKIKKNKLLSTSLQQQIPIFRRLERLSIFFFYFFTVLFLKCFSCFWQHYIKNLLISQYLIAPLSFFFTAAVERNSLRNAYTWILLLFILLNEALL